MKVQIKNSGVNFELSKSRNKMRFSNNSDDSNIYFTVVITL